MRRSPMAAGGGPSDPYPGIEVLQYHADWFALEVKMTTWWSRTVLIGTLGAAALWPLGALGARFGLWSFSIGFLFMTIGAALAALGLAGGIAATVIARRRSLPEDSRAASLGLAVCVLMLGYAGFLFWQATSVPPIHNISTDTEDPPQFRDIVALRGESSNPLAFDAAELAPLQAQFYPWVKPLKLDVPAADAFAKAGAALRETGLEIVSEHPDLGLLEATATTFWFGFKDDVAVRVRAAGQGSRIDVRSVSRVGQGDLGANARRIGEILQRMQGE